MSNRSQQRFVVQYERDEDGVWVAVIEMGPGQSVISDGLSVEEARTRIREALALYLNDDAAAESAELVDDVRSPRSE